MIDFITHNWISVLWSIGTVAGSILVAQGIRAIVFLALRRMARRKGDVIFHSLVKHGARPSHSIFPFLACLVVLPGLPLPHIALVALGHIASIGLIASIAWLAILLVDVTADIISDRYRVDVADNLTARRVRL